MIRIAYKAFVFVAILCTNYVSGQKAGEIDFKAYQAKYKNDQGVILNHTTQVRITVNAKTGELDIYETDYEEILYLKNSARFYTDGSISLSEFFESITEMSASVIKADGKKFSISEDEFKTIDSPPSSWIFHDDDKEVIFDMKELREGYRTVIQYTKKLKKPEFFDVFHFVSGYPVELAKVEIVYSPDVKISFYERAFGSFPVDRKESTDKKGNKIVSWELRNIPAYRSEEGSIPINNLIPHVVAQINSYTFGGQEQKVISSIEELHAFYEEFLLLKEDETNRKELNDVTRSLIQNKTTDIEKIDTIYKWVQNNIKYIAFEDGINGYVPRPCNLVMKNRYGDCKDMSNLLVEMLEFAGVKNAYVAWVGTRDIPYQMSEIPSPITCNHVICVVEKEDGSFYYLDATGSEMGIILPPSALQEKEILIHKGPGKFQLFKVPAVNAEQNYFRTRIEYYVDGDSIRGKGIDYLGGYERESRSYDLKNLDQEDLYDYVKDISLGGYNRYTLLNYNLSNLDDNNSELVIDYNFSVDNMLIANGNEFYFNPILFKPRVTQFNQEDHKYARNREHHRSVDYEFRFTIPTGMKVKHLPESTDYKTDKVEFNCTYKMEGNVLIVNVGYLYRLLAIDPGYFNQWNEFSDKLNKATSQSVILEKI